MGSSLLWARSSRRFRTGDNRAPGVARVGGLYWARISSRRRVNGVRPVFFDWTLSRPYGLPSLTVKKPMSELDGQVISMSISPDNRFVAWARQRTRKTSLSIYDICQGIEVASFPILDGSKLTEVDRIQPLRWLAWNGCHRWCI